MASDEQQWIKLFQYLDKRFKEVEAHFEAVDQRFDQQQATLNGIAGRLADDEIERAAITSQLDRHDSRLHQLAHKLGVKFS